MLTAEHIRAARAALNLSLDELAQATGLSASEIEAIEKGQQTAGNSLSAKLVSAFSAHGIVLFDSGQDDPGVGPGIRWRTKVADEGIRPENLSSENDG